MSLPFTNEQFLEVFRQYNAAVWPMQIVFVVLAIGAFAVAIRPGAASGRLIAGFLALLWAWTGVVYHWRFFSLVNPAARVFAVLWLAGAAGFAVSTLTARGLSFGTGRPLRFAIGCALVVYALLVYPLLGYLSAHVYPASPTFGAPCPVTIYTFGLLWLVRGRIPRWLLIAPILWAAIGSLAAFTLGVYEDLGLLVAGLSGVALLIRPNGCGVRS